MKTALITGITGQDGAYLAELLLGKGYRVYGTYRRTSSRNFWRIEELGIAQHPNLTLLEHDITDFGSGIRLIGATEPDEVYNLAAQTFVGVSFEQPVTTANITALGPLYLLEAIRIVNPKIRFYQASSAEMFGNVQAVPQVETTPFYPRSPYGIAKLFAYWTTVNYHESYGIFGCSCILFNHESPLRGRDFVTRKITDSVAKIALGARHVLELGNLAARRDWGYAKEYVEGMWRAMQRDKPDSYVFATNRTETVREFASKSFAAADIAIEWTGEGVNERAIAVADGREVVRINASHFRPAEVSLLIGNPAKAREKLGWEPSTSLEELCSMMVRADLVRNERGMSL
jgi:GDPmannose 4,6-dehydratase